MDKTTLVDLQKKIIAFRDARDWKQFHKPKDLAIAVSIETAEILEHFRFKTDKEIEEYLQNAENKKELSHEMADVMYFLLLVAYDQNINLVKAFSEKLELLEKKYPIEKCKGKPHKYTYYQEK
jgi:NTP pyrophosphatase (non-canonical NTP hydrolase)